MREPSPTALRKLLALRQFPVFVAADLGELAIVADNLVETRFAAGATVAAPAARLPAMHLVLDGTIEMRAPRAAGEPGLRIKSWSAREAFGALEVLAGRSLGSEAIAAVETRTLRLGASALHDLLEDSFGLLTAILRELALRLTALGLPRPTPAPIAQVPRDALGLVDRMIVLREHLPFLASRLEPLAMLAHAAQELRWPAGVTVHRAHDRAREGFVVLEGALSLARDALPVDVITRGGTVGVLETLGGLQHAGTITTTVPTRVLQIPSTTLFDALEEHHELALSVIAKFAGLLLDAPRDHDAFRTVELSRSREWPLVDAQTTSAN